ncbi:MAG: cyclase family protein [Gemmatimonadaceae bacterium]|nr:cyclase family protein [Gemmatimonadaceae bacterium]
MTDATLIDISIPLSAATPPWPGDVPFSCGWTCRREAGESVNLGVITTSPHVGTHADAPMHVESAWAASESLPAEIFVGECLVVALPDNHPVSDDVSVATLSALLGDRRTMRLLVRTGYSIAQGTFPDDWPALSPEAVRWLLDRGVRLWGSDAPSADRRASQTLPVHHALFAGGAYVLENLALAHVTPGGYELLAPPLAVHGADAAPVRAMLRARSDHR